MKIRHALLAVIALSATPAIAAETIPISGLPRAATPLVGTEMVPLVQNGVTRRVAASDILGSSTYFPGLTASVIGSGTAGLDMSNCTTALGCGWYIFATPISYPIAGRPTFRIDKSAPASGGTAGNTYNTLQINGTTGLNDQGYFWSVQSVLHNRTLASANAQNAALTGTVFKELNGQPAGTNIGASWGVYGECSDLTATQNPTASCIGAEIETYAVVGSGADSNAQRVALQLNGGVSNGTDTNVHIGALLLLGSSGGATVDKGIKFGGGKFANGIDMASATVTSQQLNLINFTVDPTGNTTIYGNVTLGNTGGNSLVVAGTATVGNGINMSNASKNTLFFGPNGLAAPGANSAGSKIQLLGTLGTVAATDYAVGVESNYLWLQSGGGFKWYNGTSLQMTLSSAGVLSLPGTTTGTPAASLCIDASNNIIKKTTAGACI